MKEDTNDENLREEVFKDIINKVKSVINSEISRATPVPMEGVTIGNLGAAIAVVIATTLRLTP